MLYLFTHRHLIFNHKQGIQHAGIALEQDSVRMADVFDDLFGKAFVSHYHGIDTVIYGRFTWRDFLSGYFFDLVYDCV